MSDDSLNDFEYYEGFYSLRNERLEVLMDEATFDKYMQAYLVSHGIEARTELELVEYASSVGRQHYEVEKVLHNPDYWLRMCDPNIRIIQLKSTCCMHPKMPIDEMSSA